MAYTSHGHYVPGPSGKGSAPERATDCEGPGTCKECTADSVMITGTPVNGNRYPLYIQIDGELLLSGIARLDERNRVIVKYPYDSKDEHAQEQEEVH